MTALLHTRGPWFVHDRFVRSANGMQIWADEVHVASVSCRVDKSPDQKVADAFLIAAAPELLEAGIELQAARAAHRVNPTLANADWVRAASGRFDAAIAKARTLQ